MFFCILFNLTSTSLSLENCAWISHEAILTTEALHKKEAVALIPLPDVPSLGKANFHKAAPYYSLHSQPRILLFFFFRWNLQQTMLRLQLVLMFHFTSLHPSAIYFFILWNLLKHGFFCPVLVPLLVHRTLLCSWDSQMLPSCKQY